MKEFPYLLKRLIPKADLGDLQVNDHVLKVRRMTSSDPLQAIARTKRSFETVLLPEKRHRTYESPQGLAVDSD